VWVGFIGKEIVAVPMQRVDVSSLVLSRGLLPTAD